jgi:hypothetical protein
LDVSKIVKPVKQKLRRSVKDRKEVIMVELIKLLAAGFIRECKDLVWLANPVLVPRKPVNGNSHTQPRRGRKTETKVGTCLRNQ